MLTVLGAVGQGEVAHVAQEEKASPVAPNTLPRSQVLRATSWASPGAKLVLNVGHLLVVILKGGEWLNQDVKSCQIRPFWCVFFFASCIFILIND